jgi:hypothetical protein
VQADVALADKAAADLAEEAKEAEEESVYVGAERVAKEVEEAEEEASRAEAERVAKEVEEAEYAKGGSECGGECGGEGGGKAFLSPQDEEILRQLIAPILLQHNISATTTPLPIYLMRVKQTVTTPHDLVVPLLLVKDKDNRCQLCGTTTQHMHARVCAGLYTCIPKQCV